jgi:putative transposase
VARADYQRCPADEKALMLGVVERAQVRSGQPVAEILTQLGLSAATYYRWAARAQAGQLADRVVVPRRQACPPTPQEVAAVRASALTYPPLGYKRLAWLMVDQDAAYLRPYQVYQILLEHDLLARRPAVPPDTLRRPPEPDHPDQVWHVDLMYLYIRPRWYYLVDILDGYSRFLVHWTLNLTMTADTVTLTVQEALEQLPPRRAGEPKVVHDHGSQFLSGEWRAFVETVGVTDIKTRVAHPQSNGRVERLHRTHRAEGLLTADLSDYYHALEAMASWGQYYNQERPHAALRYLCPLDYYRGDPAARLAERTEKLIQAARSRASYWQSYSNVKEPCGDPH